MRSFLLAFAVVALTGLCQAQEVDVNASALYTSPNAGSEMINVSFMYDEPGFTASDIDGEIVPGTFTITSNGFLGTNTITGGGEIGGAYLPFGDPYADEIDLNVSPADGVLTLGADTLSFNWFSCWSAVCTAAFGQSWVAEQAVLPTQSSLVTLVAVPEGAGSLPMSLLALGAMSAAYYWRRKSENVRITELNQA